VDAGGNGHHEQPDKGLGRGTLPHPAAPPQGTLSASALPQLEPEAAAANKSTSGAVMRHLAWKGLADHPFLPPSGMCYWSDSPPHRAIGSRAVRAGRRAQTCQRCPRGPLSLSLRHAAGIVSLECISSRSRGVKGARQRGRPALPSHDPPPSQIRRLGGITRLYALVDTRLGWTELSGMVVAVSKGWRGPHHEPRHALGPSQDTGRGRRVSISSKYP
jgi:hypothetical protein